VSLLVLLRPEVARSAAPYDFDADGRQELVAGVPAMGKKLTRVVGSVLVVQGSSEGLDVGSRRLVSPSVDGLPGGSEYADYFGSSLASGDFDADGYADLAIGSVDFDDSGRLGGVTVMYGSANGLTSVVR
jgi:hypothetical protein